MLLSWDGLTRRRADGALLRLITPINKGKVDAKERLTVFSQLIIPVMPQFINE
ncbi:MAG: exosortase-associated EpsI family protein [Desulfobacteraceae bacterium]